LLHEEQSMLKELRVSQKTKAENKKTLRGALKTTVHWSTNDLHELFKP